MFNLKKVEGGQVGIGTMIIFIAMILVASVAAAVLIQTSGYLQKSAMDVGEQVTEEVSTGIYVTHVGGHVKNNSVNQIIVYIRPSMGGSKVDLSQTIISLSNGESQSALRFNNTKKEDGDLLALKDAGDDGLQNIYDASAWDGTTGSQFGLIVFQDADDSFKEGGSVIMNDGDRVGVLVNTTSLFGGIDTRTQVAGELIPERGSPGMISFTTPSEYLKETLELQ